MTVADLLHREAVEYVLVGGYALNFNGVVRQTGDVDILVRDEPTNNARWIRALARLPDRVAAGLDPEDPNPFGPLAQADDDDGNGMIRIADEFVVDIMRRACGKSYGDLVGHIVVASREGRTLRVLDLEGLRMLKQGGRHMDRDDLSRIEAAIASLVPAMPIPQGS